MRNTNEQIADEEKEYYALIKLFRRLAPIYDIVTLPISSLRTEVVDFIDASKDSKILDVATGTGKQAIAFARRGYDVVGIDLSEAMLKMAIKHNPYDNLRFEVADATKLPFKDNRFDVSCVSFALHDMPLSIREKVLNEMVRVTKPGGIIAIVDYSLPVNRIGRFLIYHLVKLYEGKYYIEFIHFDLKRFLKDLCIEIQGEHRALFGAAKILKGMNKVAD